MLVEVALVGVVGVLAYDRYKSMRVRKNAAKFEHRYDALVNSGIKLSEAADKEQSALLEGIVVLSNEASRVKAVKDKLLGLGL